MDKNCFLFFLKILPLPKMNIKLSKQNDFTNEK